MKKLTLIIILLFTVIFLAPVETKAKDLSLSTKDWHDVCTRVDMNWVSFCNGYAQAIVDSFSSKEICLNSSATRKEIVILTDTFLTKNPEYKVGRAFGQIRKILKLTFPCK
jgi:hypothetical protein